MRIKTRNPEFISGSRNKFEIAFVFFLITLYLLLITSQVHAAVLYTQTAQQDVFEGQTFVVSWFLDTENISINSVDLRVDFSQDTLRVVDAGIGNSLISLWIKTPTLDNSNGRIELMGGAPNGINTSTAPLFTTTFQAAHSGLGTISLNPGSVILRNDGKGTLESLKFAPLRFTIQLKDFAQNQISSSTHQDQDQWYQNRDVVIKFNPKADTDYSFSFSSNIEIIPEDKVASPQTEFHYPNLPDGVYYFKVNSKVGPSSWQEAGVYRVQIDASPPENFQPITGQLDNKKFLSFSTVDKTSGISHYNIKVGLFSKTVETQSPYKLKKPLVGDSITVTAIDKAGNRQQATVAFPGYLSVRMFEILLVLIGVGALSFGFRHQIKTALVK